MDKEYDYIIVGAGSAGCVIAAELIEKLNATVLLVEAGGNDKSIFVKMPAGMPFVMKSKTWKYITEPEKGLKNRQVDVPQGKVLGGSSSVNGMLYVRGVPEDYHDWVQRYGCEGWSYEDVLPAFIEVENNESLAGKYHGSAGPLYVSENRYRHQLSMAFVKSAQELNYEYITDFNGAEKEGVGFYNVTIHKGRRANTPYCFLKKLKKNKRLTILLNSEVERIIFKDNTAVGIEYRHKDGKSISVSAKKEVIITAGTLATPKILMLSGIGPKDHLDEIGIPVVLDSPAVGKNYQDHLSINIEATLKEPISMRQNIKGLATIWEGMDWILFKGGIVTSNILESGGFFDLDGDGRRDTQVHTFPLLENFGSSSDDLLPKEDGVTLKLGHVFPESRGEVLLRSSSPKDSIKLYGNYLSAPGDLEAQVRAVKLGLQFFTMPSFTNLIVDVITPNASSRSDEALADFVRETAKTVFHPVGTCAMGSDPQKSVLDPQLNVRGIKNLRVADASAFPHITSGNTNASVIMLAHRAATFIINDHKKEGST